MASRQSPARRHEARSDRLDPQSLNYVSDDEVAGEDVLFRELRDDLQEDLGKVFRSIDQLSSWKSLADNLGLGNDVIMDIDMFPDHHNKGYEVLKKWRNKKGSTIRQLRSVLLQMGNNEAIRKLDEIRQELVSPLIIITWGQIDYMLTRRAPGRRTLDNYVRPYITRKLASLMLNNAIFTIELQRDDISWSSPLRDIAGSELTLTMTNQKLSDTIRPRTEEPRPTASKINVDSRNGLSYWTEGSCLSFSTSFQQNDDDDDDDDTPRYQNEPQEQHSLESYHQVN